MDNGVQDIELAPWSLPALAVINELSPNMQIYFNNTGQQVGMFGQFQLKI